MSQNYSGRVAVILVVLFGALAIVFSPVLDKLFHPSKEVTQWVNLKPGIDMVGGTSLTYQIKQPPNSRPDPLLAIHTVEALKRRVDPLGQKNYVWRPDGIDRIEIQLPSSGNSSTLARQRSD